MTVFFLSVKIFFFSLSLFPLFFLYTRRCGKHASLVEEGPGGADGWAGGGKGASRPGLGRPRDRPRWGLTRHSPGGGRKPTGPG